MGYRKDQLKKLGIHASETAWVNGDIDHIVHNDTTIDDLFEQIKNLVSDPPPPRLLNNC